MRQIRIAAAQFEASDGAKNRNCQSVEFLTLEAADQGAEVVCFHECSITGYTFLENLDRQGLLELAEPVPGGPSIDFLTGLAASTNTTVAAGLLELDDGKIYNTYAVVSSDGLVAKHRKIHAFINDEISCGDRFTVFEHRGCRFGILTCYDNNLVENVRITTMMGAEIILMPHVTGCLPSPMPGRGLVDPAIWHNRHLDPVRCRQEFDGPKGRGWLMKWLPARAFENGVYAVYANPIGMDGGQVRPGGSLILDPFGEILAECRKLDDDVVVAMLDPRKIELSSGQMYIRSRRPELYGKLLEPNPHIGPDGKPEVWWKKLKKEERK